MPDTTITAGATGKSVEAKHMHQQPPLVECSSQSSGGSDAATRPHHKLRTSYSKENRMSSPGRRNDPGAPRKPPRPSRTGGNNDDDDDDNLFANTVQDLQEAFSSLHAWATGPANSQESSSSPRAGNAAAVSLDSLIMAPCRCDNYQEVVDGRKKKTKKKDQSTGEFLSAEWKTPGGEDATKQKQQQDQEEIKPKRTVPFSWLFTACSDNDLPRKATEIVDSVMNLDQSNRYNPNNVMDDFTIADLSMLNSEEEDEMQMRRLTSWETMGTNGSIGTCESSTSLIHDDAAAVMAYMDDDGNPINPVLLEKTIATSQKRHTKRKRLVKFDYPPVSSFRQCERIDQEDVKNLFFTEEELDLYEEDRFTTAVADDVEVVAVAPSHSDEQQKNQTNELDNKLSSSYVPTPRIRDAVRKGRRPPTPARARSHSSTAQENRPFDETAATTKSPRLVKSVQIFLRERSTGSRNEEH